MKLQKEKILKLLGFGLIVVLGLTTAALIYLFSLIKDLPVLGQISYRQLAQSTKIYDRTGEILLYEIHAEEKRTIVPFEEIPDYLKKATIAIEDDDFYSHPAFDWRAIGRAIFNTFVRGRIQGGSTITQQLAKNAFLSPEKTIRRKLKELVLSIQLERRYTKDEILALYLNQIPYGANTYGVEAAAQTYFDKSVKELNLAEAAIIAALPKAPSYYSPWGYHTNELKQRQEFILDKMCNLDLIDTEERERAKKTKLDFTSPSIGNIKAPHFVMEVKEYLIGHYGEEMVEKGGLRVITSLDYSLQQLAEKVVSEGASRNEKLYQGKNAALVAQDAKTGQILALVGSRDYFDIKNEGNFNVASRGLRQPGSALKPFAYFVALKKGFTPETIVFDVPTEFDTSGQAKNSYQPKNFDNRFRGPVTLKDALAQSINVPSAKVFYLAGIDEVLKTVESFGITTLKERHRYGLSLVLGGGEVKLVELVGAYSVLSQEGIRHPQAMILKVENSAGEVLEEYQERTERVAESQLIKLINVILSDKDLRQPLFSASLSLTVFPDQEVALKTGTTNDFRDAWAIGYTPSLIVGVWAGNNDNAPMQQQAGSILAAVPIWHEFMVEVLKNQPLETFNRPGLILAEKPILRGEAIIKYKVNNIEYPQIHDTLYYVDKDNPSGPNPQNPQNDPQFQNWEGGLMNWAKINIPDFYRYNQVPPEPILVADNQESSSLEILELSPKNGEFVAEVVDVKALIKSSLNLGKIELFLNDQLIDRKNPNSFGVYEYQYQIKNQKLELQNLIKVKVTDVLGNTTEKEAVLFFVRI